MRNRASLFLVLILAFSFVTAANGQSLVGTRVRLIPTTGEGRVTGFVLAEDETSLTLDVGGSNRVLPRDRIVHMETFVPSRRGRGAVIGAVAGAVVGGLGVWAANRCGSDSSLLCDDGPAWGLVGAATVAPIGALVGLAVSPGERWQPVEQERIRLSVGPARGRGIAASLKFSF